MASNIRYLCVFFSILLTVTLVGCGAETPASNPSDGIKESSTDFKQEPTDNTDEEPNKTSNIDSSSDDEHQNNEQDDSSYPNLISAKVTKVVDGDTIEVTFDGRSEKVRLLLVDTPETVHPNKPVQPFGPEASKFAKETLSDQLVGIEIDVSERDKYGRLLAYVWIGDQIFNEMLLERGLARVAYVIPPNVKYVDRFREVQSKSQQEGIGIWSLENYAQEDGFNYEEDTTEEQDSNTSNNKYDPNDPDRDCGDFSSQAEAQAFYEAAGGPDKDPHRLDRDKDGTACDSLP
jgi:micrococcal nuclease